MRRASAPGARHLGVRLCNRMEKRARDFLFPPEQPRSVCRQETNQGGRLVGLQPHAEIAARRLQLAHLRVISFRRVPTVRNCWPARKPRAAARFHSALTHPSSYCRSDRPRPIAALELRPAGAHLTLRIEPHVFLLVLRSSSSMSKLSFQRNGYEDGLSHSIVPVARWWNTRG